MNTDTGSNHDAIIANAVQWMLWFEEYPKNGFAEALRRAAEYYHQKYAHWPNLAEAPTEWAEEANALLKRWKEQGKHGITVEIRTNVLPRHLMIAFHPERKDL